MGIWADIRTLRSSSFLRSAGTLMTGTALAQAVSVLALPFVTRLYSPEDFSLLAVFSGVLAIVSVAACLRLEVAIPIPKDDEDAINVLALAVLVGSLTAMLTAVVAAAAPEGVAKLLGQPALREYLWLLPIGVALVGLANALQFWFARNQAFGVLARARIMQSGAGASTQLGLGILGWTPLGLLLGQILNLSASCVTLTYRLLERNRGVLRSIRWRRMRSMLSAYSRFPKYSSVEALANSAAGHLPLIVIAALAPGGEAGLVMLAMYTVQGPLGMVSGSVAQVYLSRAAEEYRENRLADFTLGVFGGLMRVGVGPLIAAALFAPDLFAIVFGEDWRRAGVLVSWMAPWFVLQFVSSPLSMALPVTNHQRTSLMLMLGGLIGRVGLVYGAHLALNGFVSEAYAVSGAVFYLAYVLVIFHVVSAKRAAVAVEIRRALPVIGLWALAAAIGRLVLDTLLSR